MRALAVAAVGLAGLALPAHVDAQAYQCTVPSSLPRPHADTASAKEPQRIVPIGGYTLALTWTPEYCHGNAKQPTAGFECNRRGGSGNRFGFTLHGLWPDGIGKAWPQYCTSTALLPAALIKRHVCATPSPQLLQHEWAKHGTCMGTTPAAYFERSTGLYGKLRYPDMDALSRAPLTVGKFARAMASANPGLPAEAVRVTVNKRGWLDELWLCLDRRFAYTRCQAGSGAAAAGTTLKIWRTPR